jgi:hypothetical protein
MVTKEVCDKWFIEVLKNSKKIILFNKSSFDFSKGLLSLNTPKSIL